MPKESLLQFIESKMPMPKEKLEMIASAYEEIELQKNDFLLKEGKVCHRNLFLEKGFIRSYTYDTEGRDVTTGFYTPQSFVFEVSSFFLRTPAKENMQAAIDCKGLAISFEQTQQLFHSVPEFRELGRMMLVNSYASLKGRMLSAINESAETRYAHLLQTRPDIFQHASLKQIASFLGITDTSLSRIRKEFSKH
jgi:CRP-like cAMP-binding protein